jgi:hypothetical protein
MRSIPGVFDRVRQLLVELARRRHDDLAGGRIDDVVECDAPDDAVARAARRFRRRVHDGAGFDAVERAAVVLGNDHVLRDVDEAARSGIRSPPS